MQRFPLLLRPSLVSRVASLPGSSPLGVTAQRRTYASRASDGDLYAVLQVPQSSSKKDIKTAFYSLSKKFHPDMNQGSESAHEKFLEINQAYSVLSNDAKRREYDAARSQDSLFSSRRPAAQTWAARQQTMRRENIRPDDWVQYRGGRKAYQGTAGARRPFFDFDAHRKGHYGQDSKGKDYDDSLGKRGDKMASDEANKLYANMQAERRREPRVFAYFSLFAIIYFISVSGWIDLIFMESSDGEDLMKSRDAKNLSLSAYLSLVARRPTILKTSLKGHESRTPRTQQDAYSSS